MPTPQAHALDAVNPVMLVVAKTIEDADEYGKILSSSEFFAGAYADVCPRGPLQVSRRGASSTR